MVKGEVEEELKKWIESQMIADEYELLADHKERVNRFIGITSSGGIIFRVNPSGFDSHALIGVYMIGKLMANVAGLCEEPSVSNGELVSELGLPKGTVGRSLKELRDAGLIQSAERGWHQVIINRIPDILANAERQVTE